jgi:hypothetical protein
MTVYLVFHSYSFILVQLFKNLMMNGYVMGKIRIEFVKESFCKATMNESKLVNTILIEPPMLATIYTVSVFDLRAAHPFSRNYPVVRGQCGLKKWSSQVEF